MRGDGYANGLHYHDHFIMYPISDIPGWGASEMVWWVAGLGTKSGDLNFSPETHMIDKENGFSQVVLWPIHMHACTQAFVDLCIAKLSCTAISFQLKHPIKEESSLRLRK